MTPRRRRVFLFCFGLCAAFVAVLATRPRVAEKIPGVETINLKMQGKATVAERVAQFGETVEARWQPFFRKAGVLYPPQRLVFVAFKQEKRLEVFAADGAGVLRFVRALPVLAASGKLGPKLKYGDSQVPEGFYQIESLNPNSLYHLALRVSYPSRFDRAQAEKEDRTDLGGDIMIHGSNASIGCLAMGDEAAEDLFVLAAQSRRDNIELIISPLDFRQASLPPDAKVPQWMKPVYARIEKRLKQLPLR